MTSLSPFRTDAAVLFRRRGAAMIATFLVHAVLLLLILWGHGAGPDRAPATTALAVFDVALPPPPVQITPPPPPPPPPVSRTDIGGSAGRARTLPRAVAARAPGPPLRADVLTMETSLATPVTRVGQSDLLALPDISAGISGGAERGGAGGRADGRGSGSGKGRGNGVGLAAALWIRMPSIAEMDLYWPMRARRERIAGNVVLACIVPRPDPPRRCTVIHEYPQGVGFGGSALRMSRLFRIKPVTRGSANEDLPVIVPVSFGMSIEIKLPAKAG